jgi:hypothetical protein
VFPYNDILQLPERCLVNKRITKAFFLKNFRLSAAEKKLINTTINSMNWLASIRPTNANIQMVKTEDQLLEEVQVISCSVSNNQLDSNGTKCIEFIQKHIPYEVLLIVEDDTHFILNVCNKRVNQNDTNKRIVEDYFTTETISKLYKNELSTSFFEAIPFKDLDKSSLETVYKNYTQAIIQYQAASITGNFNKRTQKRTEQDMANLLAIEGIEKEIISISSQLKKERQLNNRVTLNVAIQKKRQEIEKIKNLLTTI